MEPNPPPPPVQKPPLPGIYFGLPLLLLVGGLLFVGGRLFLRLGGESAEKAILGNLRQLSGCVAQFALEYPNRVFVTYDELVGATQYVKAMNSVRGEDYRAFFPRWTGFSDLMRDYPYKYLKFTEPAEVHPDGVQVIKLPSGQRVEITWKDGVPDGPFRGFYPDGSRWCEATYVHGRMPGPCWIYLADGTRFNELDPRRLAAAGARSETSPAATRALPPGTRVP